MTYDTILQRNTAFVNSQVTCALIELESMKAENASRLIREESLAYGEASICGLIDKYGLGHNVVLNTLNNNM